MHGVQHLKQVVRDDARERHHGQAVATMDPSAVVFLPLDVQSAEAIVLNAPVRSDQGQDGVNAQPSCREIGCVEALFKHRLWSFPVSARKHAHKPHLA